MKKKWLISGIIFLIILGMTSTSTVSAKGELNILVLGKYQDCYETIMVNIYKFGTYSSQIISIHPGSVFLDGPEILQTRPIMEVLKEEGIKPVLKALSQYLELKISHYIIVDYDGAQAVVDAIGGVYFDLPYKVEIPETETEGALIIESGYQLFDGKMARRFLRYRDSDLNGPDELKTMKLQQLFLNAMVEQLLKEKWKIFSIALKLPKMIQTNLGVGNFFNLAVEAMKVKPDEVVVSFGIIPGEFLKTEDKYLYRIKGEKAYRVIKEDRNL